MIVEAEMVPFNERKGKIEEFWKIAQCPGDGRATWRRSGKRQCVLEDFLFPSTTWTLRKLT